MLLLALTATGLVVWLGGRWNLAYSVHAALHPLLGLIFTVVLAVGMSAHARIDKEAELRSDVSLRRRMAIGPVVILGLIVVASLQLLPGALTFVGLVLPALLYFIWSIVRFLRAELALRPVRKATALATEALEKLQYVQRVIEVGKQVGCPTGIHEMDTQGALARAEQGMQFIAVASELKFMTEAATAAVEEGLPENVALDVARY